MIDFFCSICFVFDGGFESYCSAAASWLTFQWSENCVEWVGQGLNQSRHAEVQPVVQFDVQTFQKKGRKDTPG